MKDSQEANSETARRTLYDWFTSVGYTRLAPGGGIVLIQTRWHQDDLAGRLLANNFGDDWEVVSLPAIAEHDESFRREGEAHLWRGRAEFPELKRTMTSLSEQWKPTAILVEDRASGQSLIQELKSSTLLPVIPVKVDTDKLSRAQAVTPLIEAGKVFLPDSAPCWVRDFIDEMASFPNGTYDDIVDSTSQALNYLRQESIVADGELNRIMFGLEDSQELDKEALWEKAMRGFPMRPDEIARM